MSALPTYVDIPWREIGTGPKVRTDPVDLDHVARLRLAPAGALPPIVVRQGPGGWVLVDGQHRLSARKFDSLDDPQNETLQTIRCEVVELDDQLAFEAAVKANITHGLCLSIGERTTAARRLVKDTNWSDSRIAASCGLSDKTVKDLRPPASNLGNPRLDGQKREGADGRQRPATAADAAANREKVATYLDANPDAALQEVADACGVAKETVRTVRSALEAPKDPPTETSHGKAPGGEPTPRPALAAVKPPATAAGVSVGEVVTWWPSPGDWRKTDGFEVSNAARDFAQIMDRRIPREPATVATGCPAQHRAGAAQAARIAAAWWTEIAAALEAGTRPEAVEAR